MWAKAFTLMLRVPQHDTFFKSSEYQPLAGVLFSKKIFKTTNFTL